MVIGSLSRVLKMHNVVPVLPALAVACAAAVDDVFTKLAVGVVE